MPLKSLGKFVLVGSSAVILAACSPGDVQLEGKVFDALGVNTSSTQRTAPDLKPRSGIVIPPNLSSLPQPGSGKVEEPQLADVQDYDAKRAKPREMLEKEQAEYCAKHYDMAKAMGNQDDALVEGPLGRCQKSILNMTGLSLGGDSSKDGQ